jgi:glycosyltransferase involved in cell wall biosynthesis
MGNIMDSRKKLNIAIVYDAINQEISGSSISTFRFARLLSRKGHKVIFLSTTSKKIKGDFYYQGKIKIYVFGSLHLPKSSAMSIGFASTKKIGSILKKEEIDILHVMIPTPLTLLSIKVAKKLKIKLVSHSHAQPENILLHLPPIFQIPFMKNLLNKYVFWINKDAEIVFCPSKFAERNFKKNNPSAKTMVVSNGVNRAVFQKRNPNSFIKKFNLSKNTRIFYVGRLSPEKCVDVLIRSIPFILKKYENFEVDIVGMGYQREELEKLSEKLGVRKYVKFLGKVSDSDLVLAYNACDIFVLPSLAELEGMVVLEAMACGKPILIANSKESASVDFVDGNGFLFKSKNPKDLAEKALKLLKNNVLRKKMGKKSFELAKDYDINRSIDKLEKVYYSLSK